MENIKEKYMEKNFNNILKEEKAAYRVRSRSQKP